MRKYSLCVKKNNILGEYSSFLSQALFTPRLNKLVSKRPVNIIWRHFKTVAVFSLRTAKKYIFCCCFGFNLFGKKAAYSF